MGDVYVMGLDFIKTQCLLDFRARRDLGYHVDPFFHFANERTEVRLRNVLGLPLGYPASEFCLLILLLL